MTARRKQEPRAIPPKYPTWSQREAAAESAGVEYIADLDGVAPRMYWVIRRRTPSKSMGNWDIVEHCYTVTKSEIEARVAVLNRGNPTRGENIAWGKLTKSGRRVRASDSGQLSVTEWVERLYDYKVTSDILREYKSSMRLDTLRYLLSKVDEFEPYQPIDLENIPARSSYTSARIDGDMLEAISQQIYRKFGISRARDEDRL